MYTLVKTYQYKINNSTGCQIMFIVIVKELNKEYFTTIKIFVYISVMIKLNFENPKLDKF